MASNHRHCTQVPFSARGPRDEVSPPSRGALGTRSQHKFPWLIALCTPEALCTLFAAAGLGAVEAAPIEIETAFRDFDDYWQPFLGGQGPAPAYAMALDEAARNRLRDRLRARLPVQNDGSIALTARAWAVRGRQ